MFRKITSIFLLYSLLAACAPAISTPTSHLQPSATLIAPTETSIPTVAPTEIVPGVKLPEGAVVDQTKHEIRDTAGKLIYTADLNGKWIAVTHEIVVAPASQAEWDAFNKILGKDFAYDSATGLITGVEGVKINSQGEIELNLGSDVETYHIGNIKIQNINGKPTLLVAGYAWNGETKTWNVFNPGFPLENPKDELGWFLQTDIANGNWLRWHQKATENINFNIFFSQSLKPDQWSIDSAPTMSYDWDGDGKQDTTHFDGLWFSPNSLGAHIKKENFPGHAGETFAYLSDSGVVTVSFDTANKDGSRTSLAMIEDEKVWLNKNTNRTTQGSFLLMAYGIGIDPGTAPVEPNAVNVPTVNNTIDLPLSGFYPDATIDILGGITNVKILSNAEARTRINSIITQSKDGILNNQASLEIWGLNSSTYFG